MTTVQDDISAKFPVLQPPAMQEFHSRNPLKLSSFPFLHFPFFLNISNSSFHFYMIIPSLIFYIPKSSPFSKDAALVKLLAVYFLLYPMVLCLNPAVVLKVTVTPKS